MSEIIDASTDGYIKIIGGTAVATLGLERTFHRGEMVRWPDVPDGALIAWGTKIVSYAVKLDGKGRWTGPRRWRWRLQPGDGWAWNHEPMMDEAAFIVALGVTGRESPAELAALAGEKYEPEFKLHVDGVQQAEVPEVVRTAGGDLTPELMQKAVAMLAENAVPPDADGYYHLHVASVWRAIAELAYWRLAPGYRSWLAVRRGVEHALAPREVRPPVETGLYAGTVDSDGLLLQRATEEDRAKALALVRVRWWKPQARRRRQTQKKRRGWA